MLENTCSCKEEEIAAASAGWRWNAFYITLMGNSGLYEKTYVKRHFYGTVPSGLYTYWRSISFSLERFVHTIDMHFYLHVAQVMHMDLLVFELLAGVGLTN